MAAAIPMQEQVGSSRFSKPVQANLPAAEGLETIRGFVAILLALQKSEPGAWAAMRAA
jgi:hypothetical protein